MIARPFVVGESSTFFCQLGRLLLLDRRRRRCALHTRRRFKLLLWTGRKFHLYRWNQRIESSPCSKTASRMEPLRTGLQPTCFTTGRNRNERTVSLRRVYRFGLSHRFTYPNDFVSQSTLNNWRYLLWVHSPTKILCVGRLPCERFRVEQCPTGLIQSPRRACVSWLPSYFGWVRSMP